jgi:integrase
MAKKRPNGSGTITLRKDGRWMGRVYVLTDAGFPQRETVYGETYDACEDEINKLKADHKQGIPKIKETSKFGEYLAYWLVEVVAKEKSDGTYVNYESLARNYITPALGAKTLQRLTSDEVRRFVYGNMTGKAKRLKGEEVSDRTRQQIFIVISSALAHAKKAELVKRDVSEIITAPTAEQEDTDPLTDEELAALLPIIVDHRLYALWLLFLSLGLRRGEALGLAWDDIDFTNKMVRVRYQLKRSKEKGLYRGRLKSKKSRRVLPLPEIAARPLRAWKAEQIREQNAAGARWGGNQLGLVFTTRYGRPIEASTINRTLHVLSKRSGLRALHPHALRHSCATFLKAKKVDILVIRDILGHSQLSVTADLYTHVLTPELIEAIEKMDAMLGHGSGDS